jgi:asparagine synthase (glutamine-hydrolysing)
LNVCGLAGIAMIGADLHPDAERILRQMSRAIAHRGPDGERLVLQGQVGLGFRRLALVGAEAGDQPLDSADQSVSLIVNGEVYNYRELAYQLPGTTMRTKSDCEVLAHLYVERGLRFLDNVRGMFAIVLHDKRRRRLLLARDRFGIKPLYYTRVGPTVVIASEMKALFEFPGCPRSLDWRAALSDRALHGAALLDAEPVNTWFQGIKEVPAGSVIAIDLSCGTEQLHRYWRLPNFSRNGGESDPEIVTSYRRLLAESVADCASADTGIGLFLSGGIDSSAVAALAAEAGFRINTFTACNTSTILNGDARAAQMVAEHVGLPNTQLEFPAARVPDVDEWKNLLWLLETPLCSPAQFFTYEMYRHVRLVHAGLKGMMLGQASDEFNGGYSKLFSGAEDWEAFEAALRELARGTAMRRAPELQPWLQHADSFLLADALLPETFRGVVDDPYQPFIEMKYRDIQQYNCWHEDRTAAGNGIEARVPFLDHRIVELLAEIPAAGRGGLLWDKRVLRDAVADLLPDDLVRRRKVSFYHDVGVEFTHEVFYRMLRQEHSALVEESLAAAGARDHLNAGAVRAWLRTLPARGAPEALEYLLRLINLGLLDSMVRQLPQPPSCAREVLGTVGPSVRQGPIVGEAVAWELCGVSPPSPADRLTFAVGVEAVTSIADPGIAYLAVNGQFEYVIDSEADPAWFVFLRSLRSGRSIKETLRDAGVLLEDVQASLKYCIASGLLEVEPAAEQKLIVASASMQ